MDAPAGIGRPCNLGPATQIPPGEGRVFVVGDRPLAVFRARDGRVFAAEASCPHRQGPLADGLLGACGGGCVVVCPLHAYRFDLATGAPVGHDGPPLATYPVAITPGGDLLLAAERP